MTDFTQDVPLTGGFRGKFDQGSGGVPRMWYRHPSIDVVAAAEALFNEFDDNEGFDNGTTPWTPVYWRSEYNEVDGTWTTEYSIDSKFTTPYVPVGDVIPIASVEKGITIGADVIPIVAGDPPVAFAAPAFCNAVQLELVAEDNQSFAQYDYFGDPLNGAFHRLGNGQKLIVHDDNVMNFQAVLAPNSRKNVALHVHYHYNPKPNDHG